MEELTQLIRRAQGGDLDAYGRIVGRFQNMAYGYAYARLGDFHLAEDPAQEAFVEAYRDLAALNEPAAFPGWFRRIVSRRCSRLTRGRHVPTVPLEAVGHVTAAEPSPADVAGEREMADKVLEAIQALPDDQRTATTLFYINGYSQKDIAEFLEVPVTTVNNRLAASRKRLKERMLTMVEETLHNNAPDERFNMAVIDRLLDRPRLLEIAGHPVRQAWDDMRAALADYEVVTGEEIKDDQAADAAEDHARRDYAYRTDAGRSLRYQMTTVTMSAIEGRTPPVRVLAPGRVFRPEREDIDHLKVFHQVDGACIEAGADVDAYLATCERALKAAVPGAEVSWRDYECTFVVPGYYAAISKGDRQYEVLGGGMLKPDTLERKGFDPGAVSGYAWGLGLEVLAMLRFDIDDVRKLWQPPYVPG
ncbi:MAG: sigma-70 family RNA polymerase sigma factor [Planctomycetota bacterium]|jgi:RNA polymerase sigma factor (sigma-70 family)